MGQSGDQLRIGLPGFFLAAHPLDHRAAHVVHIPGKLGDFILAAGLDGPFQIPRADLRRLPGQGDDAHGDTAHIGKHHRDKGDAGQGHRQHIIDPVFPHLGGVADSDLIGAVGKAQRIELAVLAGILLSGVHAWLGWPGLAAAGAKGAVLAAVDQDGHIFMLRRPAGDGRAVSAGDLIRVDPGAEGGIDLRLAGRNRLLAHI